MPPRARHVLIELAALPCLLVGPADASAQATAPLPRALGLPASTRAMALGDAYMMDAGHADALFYHPALLAGAGGFGLDVQQWNGESWSSAASAAMEWFGGGVGVGLVTLQYSAPAAGAAAVPPGQDFLFTSGPTPVSERVAVVGLARELFGIDVGVAAKLVEQRVGSARDAEGQFDVGAATELGPLTVGLTVHDLGHEPLAAAGNDEVGASRVVLGAGGYGQPVGPLDVGFSAAAAANSDEVLFSGGIEIGYWPIRGRTFLARFGLGQVPDGSEVTPLSFGLAYWGDNLMLEWAFQPHRGDTHRIGLRWR
jgi:hypothetical protein